VAQGWAVRDLDAGANPPLHASGRSAFGSGLSVVAQRVFSPRRTLELVPGRDPVEWESSKVLLRVGRLPSESLIGVESKRNCYGKLN
jgi:hypothetical protein